MKRSYESERRGEILDDSQRRDIQHQYHQPYLDQWDEAGCTYVSKKRPPNSDELPKSQRPPILDMVL
jgi:hypothetical protein